MFGAKAMDLSLRPPAARAGYDQGEALRHSDSGTLQAGTPLKGMTLRDIVTLSDRRKEDQSSAWRQPAAAILDHHLDHH